jgi:hypothetical protein
MSHSSPSALITKQGQTVLLRLEGHLYQISQDDLRTVLGLPPGRAGIGISIDHDRLSFEFGADEQVVELSSRQLQRRLAKQLVAKR